MTGWGGRGGGDVRGRSGDTIVTVPSIDVIIFVCCFSSAMEAQTTPAFEVIGDDGREQVDADRVN